MAHDHDHAPHDHAHDGHTHMDFAEMLPYLEQEAELTSPLYASAAAWLREWQPEPEMIVDAGSGPGIVSCLLARTFPQARVVAVDGVEPLLERAREHADRLGVADRFGTLRTDLDDGLGDLEYPADLLWASRSLHHVGDQRTALEGFARALAPGGAVALLEGGLPARYFPRDIGIGRPGLQSRIDAIQEEWFAKMRAELPGAVTETEDWPALMHAVGLRHVATRTFLLDLPAPLSDEARAFVVSALTHRREGLGEHLDADDLATLDRLLDPDDKASVHHRPDTFLLTAHTVYVGVKPE
ncbi:class I SAM-dependent methyltransferase [Streptomyces sp. NBC_00554]|uniref:class I SAM-dependent methyltransferase n=1 Tax=Streptomyces sp. NBC_00554 TaxID=2903661 RepID=UPI00352DABE5|nr:class I SAM-dependent methyltransferase [Streptomyces sp. NBC_00554]